MSEQTQEDPVEARLPSETQSSPEDEHKPTAADEKDTPTEEQDGGE